MFVAKRSDVLKTMRAVQKHLCVYMGDFCDCKYGGTNIGKPTENGNGCPETRCAIEVLRLMTDEEYEQIIARGKHLLV